MPGEAVTEGLIETMALALRAEAEALGADVPMTDADDWYRRLARAALSAQQAGEG